MDNSKLRIILFTVFVSYLFATGYLLAINVAYATSSHPGISLLTRAIFFVAIVSLFVLRKREYVFYIFLLCFPFYNIAFSGISLPLIFSGILCVLYFRDIIGYFKNNKDPNRLPFLLFCLSIIYTTFIAFDKPDAFGRIMHFVNLYLVYLLFVAAITSVKEINRIYNIIIGIGLLGALVSFYQCVFGIESIQFFFGEYNPNVGLGLNAQRIPTFFSEAQFSGIFFAMIFFFALGLSFLNKGKRWFYILVMIVSFLAMVLSGTRISLFTFGISSLIFVMRRLSPIRIFGLLGLTTILIFGSLFFLNTSTLPPQIKQRMRIENFDKNLQFRQKIWLRGLPIFIHNPLGVGLGGENLYKAGVKEGAYFLDNFVAFPETRKGTHFESSYLTILYSLGIFGFLAFLMLIWNSFRIFFKFYSNNVDSPLGKFVFCLVLSLFILSIGIGTSPQITHFQPAFLLVMFFALSSVIPKLKYQDLS